ncbi:MAG: trigger factor [Planctomycetota bacterium]|nr:MAG: trigger factor [Planctomycetota bacterium]
MEKTITDVGVLTKDISITFSKDEISAKYKDKLASIAPQMDMPGFRKGKVPSRLIERRYKDQVIQDLTQDLIQDGYKIVQDELDSVGDIDIPNFGDVKLGSEFQFTIQTSVFPKDGLPDYKGLSYTKVIKVASDEDVQEEIDKLLKSKAKLVEKKEGSSVDEEDMATYSAIVNESDAEIKTIEKQPTSAKDIVISGIDIEEADKKCLQGKKVGDVFEIKGKSNEHFDLEDYRGKELTLKVSIDKIESFDSPELSDELAKEFGLESAKDLRDKIKEQLNNQFEQEAFNKQKTDMFEEYVKKVNFELPERLLKRSLESKKNPGHHVHDENCNHEHDEKEEHEHHDHEHEHKQDDEEVKEIDEETIKSDLRKGLILEMMAIKEKIDVTQEEVSQQVMQMSQMYGMPPQQLAKMLNKEAIDNMKIEIRNDKLLTLIADNAKLEE